MADEERPPKVITIHKGTKRPSTLESRACSGCGREVKRCDRRAKAVTCFRCLMRVGQQNEKRGATRHQVMEEILMAKKGPKGKGEKVEKPKADFLPINKVTKLADIDRLEHLQVRKLKTTGKRKTTGGIHDELTEAMAKCQTPTSVAALAKQFGMNDAEVIERAKRAPNWGQFRMTLGNRMRGVARRVERAKKEKGEKLSVADAAYPKAAKKAARPAKKKAVAKKGKKAAKPKAPAKNASK